MNKISKFILLLALLIVGGFIGYLRKDYKTIKSIELIDDAQDMNNIINDEIHNEKVEDNNTQNEILDDSPLTTGLNEETIENEKATNTGTLYEPIIQNDENIDGYSDYPDFDKNFQPKLNKEGAGPSVITRTNPTDKITKPFTFKGRIRNDVERIDIIRNGDYEPFTLKRYKPGNSTFEFNMNAKYGNLQEGTNSFLIRGYSRDTLYQTIISIEYDPAPSSEELNSTYTD